jgi:hypothetical protein
MKGVNKDSNICQYKRTVIEGRDKKTVEKCKRKAVSRLGANNVQYCNEHLQEMRSVLEAD